MVTRHLYANPQAVGYTAWYTFNGVLFGFETTEGQFVALDTVA